MQKKMFLFFTALLFVLNMAFADETAVNTDSSAIEPAINNATEVPAVNNTPKAEDQNSVKITPSGFGYYQIGQIEHLTSETDQTVPKVFDQRFSARLTLNAKINEKLLVILGLEGEIRAGTADNTRISEVNLKEAQGIYSFGDPDNSFLKIAAGYFPFKYNSEAKNLGEYLYRTGTYPGYIITDFDNPKVRLMGFNFSSTLFDNLRLNALFTSEYTVIPYYDYSLSFIAAYRLPNKLLDFGAGIDFDRLVSISNTESNSEPVRNNSGAVIIDGGDTLRYTQKGVKIMGRFTFDPKPLFPFAELLGPEDFKLYGEFAILGVKNYGGTDSIGDYGYYPHMSQRMPVMVGFNIPCFKVVDVVAYEMEYYGYNPKYTYNIPSSANPLPGNYTLSSKRSFFKWSFYGQKTIVKGWAIKGLIGKDHFRSVNVGSIYDPNEHMNGPYDWHYNLRIMYSF
jgi:hypothetical protein